METTPTIPEPRQCRMCDGPATWRGVFAGNMDGWGCTDGSCRDYFLTRRQVEDKVEV